MRTRIFLLIALFCCLPVMAEQTFTLVIDAGHGGDDPGATGKFSKEKDLNLKLALKVGELIGQQYPDVKVVYTRSTDVFIPLQKRADIANKNNADLFLSIHTNAAERKEPHGVETFILGTDKMEKNLDVAMRENAVIKLEADYNTTYQGFDPGSIDSYIMFELMQNSHMEQSLLFAEEVQKRFVGHLNREDRGVRQAAFLVLLKTACPSVLFEMGFISNPEEEKYLNQPASIAQMANALVNAFAAYTHREAVKKEGVVKTEELKEQASTPTVEPAKEPVKEPLVEQTTKPIKETPKTFYAIQICASKAELAPNDTRLKGQACDTIHAGEWIKYFTAPDPDRSKVAQRLPELKALFPDCWIIKVER